MPATPHHRTALLVAPFALVAGLEGAVTSSGVVVTAGRCDCYERLRATMQETGGRQAEASGFGSAVTGLPPNTQEPIAYALQPLWIEWVLGRDDEQVNSFLLEEVDW